MVGSEAIRSPRVGSAVISGVADVVIARVVSASPGIVEHTGDGFAVAVDGWAHVGGGEFLAVDANDLAVHEPTGERSKGEVSGAGEGRERDLLGGFGFGFGLHDQRSRTAAEGVQLKPEEGKESGAGHSLVIPSGAVAHVELATRSQPSAADPAGADHRHPGGEAALVGVGSQFAVADACRAAAVFVGVAHFEREEGSIAGQASEGGEEFGFGFGGSFHVVVWVAPQALLATLRA